MSSINLGLRENAAQFSLLVLVNAFELTRSKYSSSLFPNAIQKL